MFAIVWETHNSIPAVALRNVALSSSMGREVGTEKYIMKIIPLLPLLIYIQGQRTSLLKTIEFFYLLDLYFSFAQCS